MSTPNNASNAQVSQAKTAGSTGPSTPAAAAIASSTNGAGSAVAVTAGLSTQSNAGTPRSNPPTMHPSPANHRSPLNVRSPATSRSVGGTPMMRAVSTNASMNATGLASSPMQRADTTIGLKSVGTPGKSGAIGGKTLPGSSGLGTSPGLGIVQSSLSGASPNLHGSSPGLGTTPSNNAPLNSSIGFGSPANNLSGTNAANAGLPGAVDMNVSLSNLGFSVGSTMSAVGSSSGGRLDDDERRRRLELVLEMLRSRPGRVSREAIERLGRRCELDMQLDGNELSLAGKNAVMLEIQFKPNNSSLVERVAAAFPTASDALSAHAHKASRILHFDLTPPPGTAMINASLNRFSDNLERLARLDKLSTSGANCFEAVFGVYTSLRKLYEHEKKMAEAVYQATGGIDPADIETDILCKKSGTPEMHADRRVGLSIQYWRHKRLVYQAKEAVPSANDEMDVDGTDAGGDDDSTKLIKDGICGKDVSSITIECEASSPALYPPIRVTDTWLSERISAPNPDSENNEQTSESSTDAVTKQNDQTIDVEWQDPDPTLIPVMEPDPMSVLASAHQTQPQARFIAKFEPPVILPLAVAAQIYASVELNIMQESLVPSAIESLLLPVSITKPDSLAGSNISLPAPEATPNRAKRSIVSYEHNNEENSHEWDVRLFAMRPESAIQLSQLPFSHPRQIVAILPVLRQYTFLTNLIRNTFGVVLRTEAPLSRSDSDVAVRSDGHTFIQSANVNTQQQKSSVMSTAAKLVATEAVFADFLAGTDQTRSNQPSTMDIAMSLAQVNADSVTPLSAFRCPRLTITIPGISLTKAKHGNSREVMTRISFKVLPNAEVHLELHNSEDLGKSNSDGMNGSADADQDVPMASEDYTQTQSSPPEEAKAKAESDQKGADHSSIEERDKIRRLSDSLIRALLISEDLAVWAEWVRRRFASE